MKTEFLLAMARDSIKTHLKNDKIQQEKIKLYAKQVIGLSEKYGDKIPESAINNLISDHPELSRNLLDQKKQETAQAEAEALLKLKQMIESSKSSHS